MYSIPKLLICFVLIFTIFSVGFFPANAITDDTKDKADNTLQTTIDGKSPEQTPKMKYDYINKYSLEFGPDFYRHIGKKPEPVAALSQKAEPDAKALVKAELAGNSGSGQKLAASTMETGETLQLSADKNVISVNQETDVTFSVYSESQPLAGANVEVLLHGYFLAGGSTDAEGKLTCRINPPYSGNLMVIINGQYFWSLLVALGAGEGLVELTANDMQGNALDYFTLCIIGGGKSASVDGQQGIARMNVPAGSSILKLIGRDTGNESYYVAQEIFVGANDVMQIHIDPRDTTAALDAQFTYEGNPLVNFEISPENIAYPSLGSSERVGTTNEQGHRIIHITPGQYKFKASGLIDTETSAYLTSEIKTIESDEAIQLSWSITDTGCLQFDTGDFDVNLNGIGLDNNWVYMGNAKNLVLTGGVYEISFISFSQEVDGVYYWYHYTKQWGQPDHISISPGTAFQYNLDMTLQSIQLRVGGKAFLPGENLWVEAEILTKSGYLLRGVNENYRYMELTLTKPDGSTFNVLGFFDSIMIPGDKIDQTGTYSIKALGNLGPLYGAINLEGSFTVAGKPEINVSNNIVMVGLDNEVIVTLTQGGNPMTGEPVALLGWGGTNVEGITDENGQFRTVLYPNQVEEIRIVVQGKDYRGYLFAINSDFGVVEISAQDRQSVPMESFWCSARSWQTWQGGDAINGVVRMLAWMGENRLALNGWGINGEFYMISRNINVLPGIINTIQIDTASTEEARLSFKFDGVPLSHMLFSLERTDLGGDLAIRGYAGMTDFSGFASLYVDHGTYTAWMEGYTPQGEYLSLNHENLELGSPENQITNCEWSSQDTGKFRFVTNAQADGLFDKYFNMDNNNGFSVGNNNEVILNTGTYPVKWIAFNIHGADDNWQHYEYRKPQWLDDIIIEPNKVTEYYLDVIEKSTTMNIGSEIYTPGDEVQFGVDVETMSGHLLNWYNKSNMSVVVTKPNGEVISYMSPDIRWSSFMLDFDDPAGQYEVSATLDLGPWYGVKTVTDTFIVAGKLDVSAANAIVMANMPTDVEISLKCDGSPAVGEAVELFHNGQMLSQGITDEQGKFAATITVNDPQWDREIVVIAGGREYRGFLYVLYQNEGLVEVTASDIEGNGLLGYAAEFYEDNMSRYVHTDSGVGRAVMRQGEDTIRLISDPVNGNERYVMTGMVNVIPGIVNRLHLDGKETVVADFSFAYDGAPVANGELLMQPQSKGMILSFLYLPGLDGLGHMKIHLTPGTYQTGVRSLNWDGRLLQLLKPMIDINSNSVINMSFNKQDTGFFKLNVTDQLNNLTRTDVVIDNLYMELPISKEAILNVGTHEIMWISVTEGTGKTQQGYGFIIPDDARQLTIEPEKTTVHDLSMTINSFKLQVYSKEIKTDSPVEYGVDAFTESGHRLGAVFGREMIDVDIEKPDGQIIHKQDYFTYGSYQLSPDDPEGVYTITARFDMGQRYGSHELTANFTYQNVFGVIGIDPFNGSVNVSRDAAITVTFNKDVEYVQRKLTHGKPKILLKKLNGSLVNCDFVIKGNVLTITPKKPLQENAIYVLYIPAASIVDKEGKSLESDYISCFKTQIYNKNIINELWNME